MSEMGKRRGRPRASEPAADVIRLRVTPAQRLELKRVAAENPGMGGMSGVIREAVNEYVADYKDTRIFRSHTK